MKPGSDTLLRGRHNQPVTPINAAQQDMLAAIRRSDVVFCQGPAGTGKTYFAVALACSYLLDKQVDRIVITRPAVEAGEKLGFLPGNAIEKVTPYLQPVYDALRSFLKPELVTKYRKHRKIEIAPLAFVRGRTLDDAFVVVDEAQNLTYAQLKMLLTRLGKKAKMMINGDPDQTDLHRNQKKGLESAAGILDYISGIEFVYSDVSDVVRHRLVADIINAYDDFEDEFGSE